MKFAKMVFLVAGIYGLIVLVPQFFLEGKSVWIRRRRSRMRNSFTALSASPSHGRFCS